MVLETHLFSWSKVSAPESAALFRVRDIFAYLSWGCA
jgi:hypothetical protein